MGGGAGWGWGLEATADDQRQKRVRWRELESARRRVKVKWLPSSRVLPIKLDLRVDCTHSHVQSPPPTPNHPPSTPFPSRSLLVFVVVVCFELFDLVAVVVDLSLVFPLLKLTRPKSCGCGKQMQKLARRLILECTPLSKDLNEY